MRNSNNRANKYRNDVKKRFSGLPDLSEDFIEKELNKMSDEMVIAMAEDEEIAKKVCMFALLQEAWNNVVDKKIVYFRLDAQEMKSVIESFVIEYVEDFGELPNSLEISNEDILYRLGLMKTIIDLACNECGINRKIIHKKHLNIRLV
jgi:hypothetical protein